jgi:hypothetical protein
VYKGLVCIFPCFYNKIITIVSNDKTRVVLGEVEDAWTFYFRMATATFEIKKNNFSSLLCNSQVFVIMHHNSTLYEFVSNPKGC